MDHPSFRKMIGIGSRATKGVIIPNRHTTRSEIIDLFKKQMAKLKDLLNVSYSLFDYILHLLLL